LLGVKPGATVFDRPLWRGKSPITTDLKPLLSILAREYASSPSPNLFLANYRLSLRERTIRFQPTRNLSTKLGYRFLTQRVAFWLAQQILLSLSGALGSGSVCSISDTSLSSSFLFREHSLCILTRDSN
jgi:hypothetical protein